MTEQILIDCTEEERHQRLEFCKKCENLKIEETGFTVCSGTGCNINFMIGFKFKQCPKENW